MAVWLGIWITSFIFIGIHGYFKFKSVGHLLFGAMMFGLSMMLGYLFEFTGLITAMTAHAVYDVIMLQLVQDKNNIQSTLEGNTNTFTKNSDRD